MMVPHLFEAISSRAKRRTVHEAMTDRRWVSDIRGALTVNVLIEYLGLWDLLLNVELQPELEDSHTWRFSASGVVKSVGAQDRRTTTTKLVALAGNGAGVFAQALYGGEREEDERGREIRDN